MKRGVTLPRSAEPGSGGLGKAWISLDSLVRNEPFQGLTRLVRSAFLSSAFLPGRFRLWRLDCCLGRVFRLEIGDDAIDLVEQLLPLLLAVIIFRRSEEHTSEL